MKYIPASEVEKLIETFDALARQSTSNDYANGLEHAGTLLHRLLNSATEGVTIEERAVLKAAEAWYTHKDVHALAPAVKAWKEALESFRRVEEKQ